MFDTREHWNREFLVRFVESLLDRDRGTITHLLRKIHWLYKCSSINVSYSSRIN